jgi:hypothetical protein
VLLELRERYAEEATLIWTEMCSEKPFLRWLDTAVKRRRLLERPPAFSMEGWPCDSLKPAVGASQHTPSLHGLAGRPAPAHLLLVLPAGACIANAAEPNGRKPGHMKGRFDVRRCCGVPRAPSSLLKWPVVWEDNTKKTCVLSNESLVFTRPDRRAAAAAPPAGKQRAGAAHREAARGKRAVTERGRP